jgi:hypothetical protein
MFNISFDRAIYVLFGLTLLSLGLPSACAIEEVMDEPGIASVGDPCAENGSFSCTEKGGAELVCENGWFRESQLCEGGCEILENEDGENVLLCKDLFGAPK